MATTHTQRHIASKNILRADDVNEELAGTLGQINGNLDQQNMPLESVGWLKVAPNVLYSYNQTVGTQGAASAHYTCTADDTIEFTADGGSIFSGWTSVDDDFKLEFPSKEGMVFGSVTICGSKLSTFYQNEGLFIEFGAEYAFQFGVFVNNILCGETGEIFAHKYTVDLPYSLPVGNGDCVIDVRFICPPISDRISGAIQTPSEVATAFKVINRHLWCRNQYR